VGGEKAAASEDAPAPTPNGAPAAAFPAATRPITLVTDPAALAVLASAGAALDNLVSAESLAVVRKSVADEIAAVDRSDAQAGVGIRGNAHRLFDARWLSKGRFDLVGLVYRVDHIPITPGHCGDLRLVYRLGYTAELSGEKVSSHVPMTLMVVLTGPAAGPGGDCQAAARSWLAPAETRGEVLGTWLSQGPLKGRLLGNAAAQVLINFQLVRWPSAVRPDLGGHAEYVLRAFLPDRQGVMAEARLDNTPDVTRLSRDRAAREQLVAWLSRDETLTAIADGSAMLPEPFRATRAVSVAPRGLARRANRPFRQLFEPSVFAELPLAGRDPIASPEALVRRLDDMTCVGCHQSRTIAGFHLLGEDGPDEAVGNALAVAMSAPLVSEHRRRDALVLALAAGKSVDFTRPMSERPPGDKGGEGARCGLGDPGFAAWTCAAGLRCEPGDVPADDAAVGYCMSEGPVPIGGACEMAPLRASADPHRDRATRPTPRECEGAVCNGNRVGFPGGMCTASCDDLPAGGACGVIALLTPFNNCLARKTPFPRCLAEHVAPAGLRACSIEHPCREDYICARTPSGQGACIPPYFLFQMRVDGHP